MPDTHVPVVGASSAIVREIAATLADLVTPTGSRRHDGGAPELAAPASPRPPTSPTAPR